jgi:hypothetical protein
MTKASGRGWCLLNKHVRRTPPAQAPSIRTIDIKVFACFLAMQVRLDGVKRALLEYVFERQARSLGPTEHSILVPLFGLWRTSAELMVGPSDVGGINFGQAWSLVAGAQSGRRPRARKLEVWYSCCKPLHDFDARGHQWRHGL